MIIAINSTHLIKSAGDDLFYNYFLNIAALKPQHQFIFITSPAIGSQQIIFQNITHVISAPVANYPLMWKIWLDYTLPAIARKHGADLIINTGGFCPLRTRMPQLLFISDLSFLYFPQFFSKKQLHFLKKSIPAFLLKANKIVTASGFLTKDIIQRYSIEGEKINTFQLTAGDHYQPLGWNEKEAVREKYAEGKEYFLFSGEIHPRNNLVNLLKAFSFFKKRQKTNMRFIITAKAVSPNNPFIEMLKTYKYREEVQILTDLPETDLAEITGAAYAFIYPALYDGAALCPLQAMQCEVPVITGGVDALKEIAGDAALYTDPLNFEDIADKMMLLFKDETKRAELINKGKLVTQRNKKDEPDKIFWDFILKTIV